MRLSRPAEVDQVAAGENAPGMDMPDPQAGSEHPRWFERYPWVAVAWSRRLPQAGVVGVVIGLITWRIALGAGAAGDKAAATGAVVGLLLTANYGFLALAARRSRNFHAEHPWASAMTFVVPLAVLLPTLHYVREEASLARTLVSAGILIVLGGVAWRFLNPLR